MLERFHQKLKIPIVVVMLAFYLLIMPYTAHAGVGDVVSNALTIVPGYIMSWIILPLGGLLVYLSAMILNYSVNYSVIEMKMHYDAIGLTAIWVIVRDLANMSFIFVLLYTALRTAFGNDDYKRTIVNVVIAAILINFSLFITEAVVDLSNELALLFYHAIAPAANASDSVSFGLASGFMDVLGIQSLHSLATGLEGTKIFIIGILGTAIYIITTVSFVAIAVMFIIRFIALLLVIVLSPIYAISKIFPAGAGADKYAKMWFDTLIGQSFFAPAYFMFTWITLFAARNMFSNANKDYAAALRGSTSSTTSMVTADPGSVQVIVIFFIIIGLMIASLILAKKVSDKSVGVINGITGKVVGLAGQVGGGATLGAAAALGRNTLGRAGSIIGNDDRLKDKAVYGNFAQRNFAKAALWAGRKTSEQSFDARGIGGLGKVGIGSVSKEAQGGFKKTTEEAAKRAAARAKLNLASKELNDADKKEREATRDAAAKKLEEARKAAAEKAKELHPDAAKSAGLVAAEKAEQDAHERFTASLSVGDSNIRERHQKEYQEAKAAADKLREEHTMQEAAVTKAREAHIDTATKAEQKAHEEAKERAKRTINQERAEHMARNEERTWVDREVHRSIADLPLPGKRWKAVMDKWYRRAKAESGKPTADAIRKTVKEETKKEKAEKAALEYLKEQEEEKKKSEGQPSGTSDNKGKDEKK